MLRRQFSAVLLLSASLLCLFIATACASASHSSRRNPSVHTEEAEHDRVLVLPGWGKVRFGLFSGYFTVSEENERAFFYVFAEAQQVDPATAPVVLWLNGGPGCSSLGGGFLSELGPFYPRENGRRLKSNPYSWNHKANIIFLESPAFVGFSYSNTSSDIASGDAQTAVDNHVFLKLFFQRFPQYAANRFWLAGESYAGHYLPQLAHAIVSDPNNTIPFKGFLLGNPLTDPYIDSEGALSSWYAHGLISDQSYQGATLYCNFSTISPLSRQQLQSSGRMLGNASDGCDAFIDQATLELGDINIYDIYQDVCMPNFTTAHITQMARLTSHLPNFFVWRHAAKQLERKRVQAALRAQSQSKLQSQAQFQSQSEPSSQWQFPSEPQSPSESRARSQVQPQPRTGIIARSLLSKARGDKDIEAGNGGDSATQSSWFGTWQYWLGWLRRGGLSPAFKGGKHAGDDSSSSNDDIGRHGNNGGDDIHSGRDGNNGRGDISGRDGNNGRGDVSFRDGSNDDEEDCRHKVPFVDPCVDYEVAVYLNLPRVQAALHANTTGAVPGPWADCNDNIQYNAADVMLSMLPLYPKLIDAGIKIVIYSGDVDGILPTLGTRSWVSALGLKVVKTWHPWHDSAGQTGGWAEVYDKNVAIVAVRNAGHMVPYTQPRRAYDLFQSIVLDHAPSAGPVAVRSSW